MVILAKVLIVFVRFFFEVLVEACSSILLLPIEGGFNRSGQIIPQSVNNVTREAHRRNFATLLDL